MWDRDQERRDDRGGPRDLRENLDRGRRDVDRGRDRGGRRSRSRSRSRSRERMGKRRADSPFSKAHDNWSKFKQAEKVITEFALPTLESKNIGIEKKSCFKLICELGLI